MHLSIFGFYPILFALGLITTYAFTWLVYVIQGFAIVLPLVLAGSWIGDSSIPLAKNVVPVLLSVFQIIGFSVFGRLYVHKLSQFSSDKRTFAAFTLVVASSFILLPIAFGMLCSERSWSNSGLLGMELQSFASSMPDVFCSYYLDGKSPGTIVFASSIFLCIFIELWTATKINSKLVLGLSTKS